MPKPSPYLVDIPRDHTAKRPGRPAMTPSRPATVQVQARVPEDTAEAIRAIAEATGRSTSAIVRELIERGLQSRPEP